MNWVKLYQILGRQPICKTKANSVCVLLSEPTTKADKSGLIDLSKEDHKVPLSIKFDKYGVPYFVLELEVENKKKEGSL